MISAPGSIEANPSSLTLAPSKSPMTTYQELKGCLSCFATIFSYNLHFLFSAHCQLIQCTKYEYTETCFCFDCFLEFCFFTILITTRKFFLHLKLALLFLLPSPPQSHTQNTRSHSLSYTKQNIKHLRFVVAIGSCLGFQL